LVEADPKVVGELSPDGFTALHLACFGGSVEAAKLLSEHGADPNVLSEQEFIRVRPLGTAAFSRSAGCAEVLLAVGADPNLCGEGGFAPLHVAAQNGDSDLVRLLLSH